MIGDWENVCCRTERSGLGGGIPHLGLPWVYYHALLRGTSAEVLWHLLFYQPTQTRNLLLKDKTSTCC